MIVTAASLLLTIKIRQPENLPSRTTLFLYVPWCRIFSSEHVAVAFDCFTLREHAESQAVSSLIQNVTIGCNIYLSLFACKYRFSVVSAILENLQCRNEFSDISSCFP